MRGERIQLAGSVYARPNGTFTAVTPPVPERFTGRKRRSSLGTFTTEDAAFAELRQANLKGFDAPTLPVACDVTQMTLEAHLDRWVRGPGRRGA